MKIKGAKQVHYDSGPNMTPLVDVVMVILIFLMLAGSFGGMEHYLLSNLPLQERGPNVETVTKSDKLEVDEPLEVRVDSPVPDRFVARFGGLQAQDGAALRAGFRQLYQRMEQAAPGSTDKTQIVISPGRHVKYAFLIQVYEAAAQEKFKKIAFATSH